MSERDPVVTLLQELDRPVAFDPYAENRATGGFVLVDPLTGETVGAGMIKFALRRAHNVHLQHLDIDKSARATLKRQEPCVLWLTGLSGAGKSTLANLVEKKLHAAGYHTYVLDGDNVRGGLCADLGFAPRVSPGRFRAAFVAPEGTLLIAADWSQIELRVLAHFSRDARLLEAFEQNLDLHRRTAAILFGVAPEAVTPEQRNTGKTINFATIYGQGATALGQILGIKRQEAARYIEQLWASRKAGALSREIRLRGQTRETMDALKQLALRYGILTEYTSYLVQEPTVALRREAESRQLQAPAAAPADQAGANAVGRSAQERSMRDAFRLDAVVVTASGAANPDSTSGFGGIRARSGINPTQRVGGRLFVMRDSTWTDLGHGDSLRVVSIAPYSEAYFALLRALPDLREAAGLEPAVLVAGRRASIKIGAGGKTEWRPGELERLVREFRG